MFQIRKSEKKLSFSKYDSTQAKKVSFYVICEKQICDEIRDKYKMSHGLYCTELQIKMELAESNLRYSCNVKKSKVSRKSQYITFRCGLVWMGKWNFDFSITSHILLATTTQFKIRLLIRMQQCIICSYFAIMCT